ncbi:nucleoporin Nup120/160-domain-containing protein [Aspergillus unguis]
MAKIYKDTQVDLRPYSPRTVANIPIPTQTSSQNRARFTISSLAGADELVAKDEDEFARRYVATQGSVYFRKRNVYPRAFLWRVVNESKVLEIQCVDLTKGGIEHFEYNVTLRLDFQEEILPSGVTLADSEEHDVLNVFVITASKELHTLTLRPEYFRKAESIDEKVSDWCKSYIPAPLTFSHPHRLYASSPLELFISLDNGALLRLTRRAADDGSHWSPLTLDERTWGASLRGLVRWHAQTSVKYGDRNLDASVANAVATTSDQTYVFAACLNHTLKIWNLATNKLVATKDLLGRELQQHGSLQYSLNPAESSFIRVFSAERALDGGYRYYVVTYSPFEDGCFKFWAVKGGLTTPLEIEDLFPDTPLRPVDPDASGNMFWSIADFQVKPAEEGKRMELWVLWRNSGLYQLYTLHFNFESLVSDWESNWTTAASDTRRQEPPPRTAISEMVDPTEKWLKFLLQPNRFPSEVLETALAIYQEALKPLSSTSSLKKSVSLPERLCSTIAAAVSLRRFEDDEMDFSRYRTDTDSRWRQFWQIADDLNKRRFEPLTLSYDLYYDTPWLSLTDGCAVVRECSSTELLLHNPGRVLQSEGPKIADRWRHRNLEAELGDLFEEASHLMTVASDFRKKFSADLEAACQGAIEAEIFTEPSSSVQDRLDAFRDRCDFSEQISNRTYEEVISDMNQQLNIYMLSSEIFYKILETVPPRFPAKDSDLLATHFGVKFTVNGVQETILFTRQLLIDLLVLVVFVDSEVQQEDGSTFDAVGLFVELVTLLREYEMISWLSSNTRKASEKAVEADDSSIPSFSLVKSSNSKNGRVATLLEDLFATDIKPRQAIGLPQSYTLTLGIQDVLSWATRPGEVAYPNVLAFIQCDLIANGNLDLAWDFLRFQSSTSWSTYVKGRLHVAMSELDTAALYFRKAAYLLSCGKPLGNLHEMSSTLLDLVSVNSFYNGLPRYFQHVLSIFEEAHAPSHVSEFASLALQALASEHADEQDPDVIKLKNELLTRQFYASVQICQFDQAYSALSRYQEPALQRSALSTLITSILAASGPGSAGLDQILHFPTTLIPNIASHVDEILVSLARKQPTSTPLYDSRNKWAEGTVDYQRVLQAYRIKRGDYRGAAEVAYHNVERLRHARDTSTHHLLSKAKAGDLHHILDEDDPESSEIRHELLSLINLLACVDKSEAYILVDKDEARSGVARAASIIKSTNGAADNDGNVFMDDADTDSQHGSISSLKFLPGRSTVPPGSIPPPTASAGAQGPRRRVIVTLDHLRREYQSELDRVSRIERGDWEFGFDAEVGFDLDGENRMVDNDDTMVLA